MSDCVREGEGFTPFPDSVIEGSHISSELQKWKTKKKERGGEKREMYGLCSTGTRKVNLTDHDQNFKCRFTENEFVD